MEKKRSRNNNNNNHQNINRSHKWKKRKRQRKCCGIPSFTDLMQSLPHHILQSCVLEMLSLQDRKQLTFISQQWKSLVDPIILVRGTMKLAVHGKRQPQDSDMPRRVLMRFGRNVRELELGDTSKHTRVCPLLLPQIWSISLALQSGVCPNLKKLTLSHSSLMAKAVPTCSAITSTLMCGIWSGSLSNVMNVKHIKLCFCVCGESGIKSMAMAFHNGGLSQLESLELQMVNCGLQSEASVAVEQLMNSLGSTVRTSLTTLTLVGTRCGPRGVSALSRAIIRGVWPELRHLWVSECPQMGQCLHLLSEALASQKCSHLQSLSTSGTGEPNNGQIIVLEALCGGACPNLKALSMFKCFNYPPTMQTLERLLMSYNLQQLEALEFTVRGSDNTTLRVMRALKQGMCPRLRYLNIEFLFLKFSPISELAAAMKFGCLHCLEWLSIESGCYNDSINSNDLKSIASALELGCCPNLKYLGVDSGGSEDEGTYALANALRSGNCALLQFAHVGIITNSQNGTNAILDAMKSGSCPDLRILVIPHHSNIYSTPLEEQEINARKMVRESGCPKLEMIRFDSIDRYYFYNHIHRLTRLDDSVCVLNDLRLLVHKNMRVVMEACNWRTTIINNKPNFGSAPWRNDEIFEDEYWQ